MAMHKVNPYLSGSGKTGYKGAYDTSPVRPGQPMVPNYTPIYDPTKDAYVGMQPTNIPREPTSAFNPYPKPQISSGMYFKPTEGNPAYGVTPGEGLGGAYATPDTPYKPPKVVTEAYKPSTPTTPTEPVKSYEDWLADYGAMRDTANAYYDSMYEKANKYAQGQLTAQKNAADEAYGMITAEAERAKDALMQMSQKQLDAVYKFAEEQRISDIEYAAAEYLRILDAINKEKESGMAMAEETKSKLLQMSEEQRKTLYDAAAAQRAESDRRTEIARERGVVDARSAYAQNKAEYGANAEAMGNMGLTGSGYSAYLDSKAYATERGETQAVNAAATKAKEEAAYRENMTQIDADMAHNQTKFQAEQAYSQQMYEIEKAYNAGKLTADERKAAAEKAAYDREKASKYGADQAHSENEFRAEEAYSNSVVNAGLAKQQAYTTAESAYSDYMHQAEKEADAGHFNAELAYQQAIHAENKNNAQDGGKTSGIYSELLATTGEYTKDQIELIMKDNNLTAEQKESVMKQWKKTNADNLWTAYAQNWRDADGAKAIKNAFMNGDITSDDYYKIQKNFNNALPTDKSFFYDENGVQMTKAQADAAMNAYIDSGFAFRANIDKLVTVYDELYGKDKKRGFKYVGGNGVHKIIYT